MRLKITFRDKNSKFQFQIRIHYRGKINSLLKNI